jgi:hypothetical protein
MLVLAGCASRAYVDPGLPRVDYDQIERPECAVPVEIAVQYQVNEDFHRWKSLHIRSVVLNTLRSSGIFNRITTKTCIHCFKIDIVLNEVIDILDVIRKKIRTGLTFYAARSMNTDYYVFTGTLYAPQKAAVTKKYNHAIYLPAGDTKPPEGLKPMKPDEALDAIVEQLVLNFLKDLQAEGCLR